MNFFKAILLGLIQGFTEFLPVSSSGHLVIFQQIFGIESTGVTLEVLLHFGTWAVSGFSGEICRSSKIS